MYLSISEYKKLEEIKNNMTENKDKIVFSFVLAEVLERHKESNKKTYSYIAEKRKDNKNYARGKKK